MQKENLLKILNGKWIYEKKPGLRTLFHFFISGPLILIGGILIIAGEFPPPINFNGETHKIELFFLRIFAILWIYWVVRAFIKTFLYNFFNWTSKRSSEEMKTGWQIITGKCPHCLKKISSFATKCPYCTADLK